MGFKLKNIIRTGTNIIKNPINALNPVNIIANPTKIPDAVKNPLSIISPSFGLADSSLGAGIGHKLMGAFGGQPKNQNSLPPAGASPYTSGPTPVSVTPPLSTTLENPVYHYADSAVGPGVPDNTSAYQAALSSAETQRAKDEKLSTENILGQLQGRGIADSGIAEKDIIQQVLGPSLDRGSALAAQFGLQQAKDTADVYTQQRNFDNQLNQAKYDSSAKAALTDQALKGQIDITNLTGQQRIDLQNLIGNQAWSEMLAKQAYDSQHSTEAETKARKQGIWDELKGVGGNLLAAFS